MLETSASHPDAERYLAFSSLTGLDGCLPYGVDPDHVGGRTRTGIMVTTSTISRRYLYFTVTHRGCFYGARKWIF